MHCPSIEEHSNVQVREAGRLGRLGARNDDAVPLTSAFLNVSSRITKPLKSDGPANKSPPRRQSDAVMSVTQIAIPSPYKRWPAPLMRKLTYMEKSNMAMGSLLCNHPACGFKCETQQAVNHTAEGIS